MSHLFQVGVGSGGMPVLDMVCREDRVSRVTIVEPDVFKPHNVVRHLFGPSAVGKLKGELAAEWLQERRSDLVVDVLPVSLLDSARKNEIEEAVQACDLGICAADNEEAKYHFDALMRHAGKPWTLGEVLSGGIGGFVHWFRPGGACYGCVASHLHRTTVEEPPPDRPPDYSAPGGPVQEARIPASMAAIHVIASLHAVVTLGLLADPGNYDPGFTTLLLPLAKTAGVFDEAFRPLRLRIARSAECLICRTTVPTSPATAPEDLDVALDQALARLGDA